MNYVHTQCAEFTEMEIFLLKGLNFLYQYWEPPLYCAEWNTSLARSNYTLLYIGDSRELWWQRWQDMVTRSRHTDTGRTVIERSYCWRCNYSWWAKEWIHNVIYCSRDMMYTLKLLHKASWFNSMVSLYYWIFLQNTCNKITWNILLLMH